MNKNLNNQNDRGAQRGQMQQQGSRQNDTPPQGGGTNMNSDRDRDREPSRVESWSNPNPEREEGIHPAEPTIEKNLNRERETQPVGREANLNRDKERVETTAEKTLNREKEPIVKNSEPIRNTSTSDGSPSTRSQAMNDRETAYKSSTFQSHTPQESKLVEELKAPAITGAGLYVIAAILLVGWAAGFFYYNAGPAIHILLVLALVSVLIKVVQGRSV